MTDITNANISKYDDSASELVTIGMVSRNVSAIVSFSRESRYLLNPFATLAEPKYKGT
jgi:hypothetical protein